MTKLSGQHAIITGAAQGLGYAVARAVRERASDGEKLAGDARQPVRVHLSEYQYSRHLYAPQR